ncbi:GntR family transcriptional regulator [Planococcus sp. N028]|uniref:GntR family transcriptional regulator n=1 Tax=Planococcus shixiaomingii TaxID=3058393 RepID=A0ABT8N4S3_9BACL|nr:GntR family transcriptional regulator [Planococcus sp. N028]MDN7242892.1 GntR family transcriptional regulator [Planococcus sp. N028]
MYTEKKIDKEGVVPIYYQLKTMIKEQVEGGRWKPDDMIPSERELSEKYKISRATVRQAINELVQEGILYRKRGMGTYVAKPKINQGLTKLTSFTSDMQRRGHKPGSKVLHMKVVPPSKKAAEALMLDAEDEVVELFRLRLADDEPMAIEKTFLPLEKVSPLLNDSLENKSLYAELKEKCNLDLVQATQTIEISYPDQTEAQFLGIRENEPVLLIERTTFLENSIPIEYVCSLYRADRYKFTIEMKA